MHIPSDKYNVAWFKLAECVSRGEKERALGVYRLLSHSFDDKAFASQLEGDIFCAFGDKKSAKERYDKAIGLYTHAQRVRETAALSENMHSLYPNDTFYLQKLTDAYVSLSIIPKAVHYLLKCVSLVVANGQAHQAADMLSAHDHYCSPAQTARVRQDVVYGLLKEINIPETTITYHITKVIDGLLENNNDTTLHQFFGAIQGLSEHYYLYAYEYLEQKETTPVTPR